MNPLFNKNSVAVRTVKCLGSGGKPKYLQKISREIKATTSHVSKVIISLKKGGIVIDIEGEPKRTKWISLSPKGKILFDKITLIENV